MKRRIDDTHESDLMILLSVTDLSLWERRDGYFTWKLKHAPRSIAHKFMAGYDAMAAALKKRDE